MRLVQSIHFKYQRTETMPPGPAGSEYKSVEAVEGQETQHEEGDAEGFDGGEVALQLLLISTLCFEYNESHGNCPKSF